MSVVLCLPAHLRVSRSVPWPAPHGNASLVVVVWVVVGLVLRVWPMESLWVFRSPLWGWGVGHRGQSPGLHYVVGMGEGLGAGLHGDGG